MKNSQKGFISIIIIILVILIIAAVGYFFYIKKSQSVSQVSTAPVVDNTPKPIDTSTWATYQSTTGSLSFKAPSEFDESTQKSSSGTDVLLVAGDKYYQSLGVTGDSRTAWTVSAGSTKDCASTTTPAGFTGTRVLQSSITISNKTFSQIYDSSRTLGTTTGARRYVGPLMGNICQFIEFNNVKSLNIDPSKLQTIVPNNQTIDDSMQKLIPMIVGSVQLSK